MCPLCNDVTSFLDEVGTPPPTTAPAIAVYSKSCSNFLSSNITKLHWTCVAVRLSICRYDCARTHFRKNCRAWAHG